MADKEEHKDKITEAFANIEIITDAIQKGINEALLRHKKLGQPVVFKKDGKTVWLQPDEIEV
ncbi:hypothetical protein H8E50_07900 [bacterium]|nr:hypothetical protein [bacterium]